MVEARRKRTERAILLVIAATITFSCLPEDTSHPSDHILIPETLGNLDPIISEAAYGAELWNRVYARLVTVDPLSGEVSPDLAASWFTSDDGLRWTFFLDRDRRFSSGRDITAEDVRASLIRIIDPRTGSPYAQHLYVIENAEEVHTGSSIQAPGIIAVDAHTLEIHLRRPAPHLPAVLATVGYITMANGYRNPGGAEYAGQYAISQQSWESLRLLPNAGFGPTADLPALTLTFAGTAARAVRLFERSVANTLVLDTYEAVRPAEPVEHAARVPLNRFYYLQLNGSLPPTSDVSFRSALLGSVARSVVATQMPEGARLLGRTVPYCGQVEVRAQFDVIDDAPAHRLPLGANGGKEMSISVGAVRGTAASRILGEIAEIWRSSLGVQASVVSLSRGELLARLDEGDLNGFVVGYRAPFPDPKPVFEDLFAFPTSANWVRHQIPDFDTIVSAAALANDSYERSDMYATAGALLTEQHAFLLPLYQDQRLLYRRNDDRPNDG